MFNKLFTRLFAPEDDPPSGGGTGTGTVTEPEEVKIADTEENWEGPNPYTDEDLEPGETPDLSGIIKEEEDKDKEGEEQEEEEDKDKDKDKVGEEQEEEGDPPQRESRKTLREELDSRRTQVDELEGQVKSFEEEKEKLTGQIEELRTEIKNREERYVESRSIQPYNPNTDPEIGKLTQDMSKEVNFAKSKMSNTEYGALFTNEVDSLLDAYTKTIESGQNLGEWREKVAESFPEDAERIETVMEKLHDLNGKRFQIMKDNHTNWDQKVKDRYREDSRKAADSFAKIGNLTEDEIEAAPYHPDAIITQLAEKNPEFAEKVKKARKDAMRVAIGMPPLDPNASEEEVRRYQANEQAITQAREKAPYALAHMQLYQEILPSLWQEVTTLRKRLADKEEGNRADSKFDAGKEKPKAKAPSGSIDEGEEYEDAPNPYLT